MSLMYTTLLVLSVSSCGIILTLLIMEIFSWMFSLMLSYEPFKYLVVQSTFLILSLLGLMWAFPVLIASFVLKTGLPPLHFWLVNLALKMKKMVFFFMMTMHKILPILTMSTLMASSLLVVFLFMSSGAVMMNTSSFLHIFIFSSAIQTCWFLFSVKLDLGFFFFYWSAYTLLSFSIMKSIVSNYLLYSSLGQTLITTWLWLILSGLPPFTIFFMKSNLVVYLTSLSLVPASSAILSSILSLVIYYRVFHYNLSLSQSFKTTASTLLISTSLFLGII